MSKTVGVTEILAEIKTRTETMEKLEQELGKKSSPIELVAKACQKYFEDFLTDHKKEVVAKKKKKKVKIPQGYLINKVGNS